MLSLSEYWARLDRHGKKISCSFLCKKHWFLIHTCFFFAFLIQVFSIVDDLLHPTQTTTSIEEQKLEELPILFKICINPGFNMEKIKEEGYLTEYQYVLGKSQYDNTTYGWAGHSYTGNETVSSVRGE